MAKIKLDTGAIPGFDALPPEAQAALANLQVEAPDPDYSGYVAKSVFDKKASEAADLSKKLKARMSEEEQRQAERDQEMGEMRSELERLRRDKAVSDYTARFAGLGYDEALAASAAAALADGNMEAVFAAQKQFQAASEQRLRSELLYDTPKPAAGSGGSAEDYQRLYDRAVADGDQVAAAHYMRLMAQEEREQI